MADSNDLDFRDLTRAALERMLKKALLKNCEHEDKKKEVAHEDADEERNDLADLVEEKNGSSKAPEVEEDDIPRADAKVAAKDSKDDDDKPKKKGGFPFKKKGGFPPKKKAGFPFQKKG